MGIMYYSDLAGNYIGAFNSDNPNIPNDGIEIPIPPDALNQIWNGDTWITVTSGASSDVHSGKNIVNLGEQYIILEGFQSIVKDILELNGDLIVDGQLFMEA